MEVIFTQKSWDNGQRSKSAGWEPSGMLKGFENPDGNTIIEEDKNMREA